MRVHIFNSRIIDSQCVRNYCRYRYTLATNFFELDSSRVRSHRSINAQRCKYLRFSCSSFWLRFVCVWVCGDEYFCSPQTVWQLNYWIAYFAAKCKMCASFSFCISLSGDFVRFCSRLQNTIMVNHVSFGTGKDLHCIWVPPVERSKIQHYDKVVATAKSEQSLFVTNS